MSNMSYCQFENTSNDIRQLLQTLDKAVNEKNGQLKLSEREENAFQSLREQCEEFISLADEVVLVDDIEINIEEIKASLDWSYKFDSFVFTFEGEEIIVRGTYEEALNNAILIAGAD